MRDRKKNQTPPVDYTPIVFSEEKIEHAKGVVAASSNDAEDARLLLESLGLMPDQQKWWRDS